MKRRLTLARALINDPELLFLDEPTTGLDPQARHVIWERLRNLLKQGKTLLLTTHFMEEAERLCSRIAIMDHGKIITGGDPRALIAQHVEPHVVEVYGEGAPDWAEAFGRRYTERCEITGETIFCYINDPAPLIADLDGRGDLRYLHRRANIEDVFLKLTGRDLRD
jgi:lipooligosaccharide transport system ATP-binding protein